MGVLRCLAADAGRRGRISGLVWRALGFEAREEWLRCRQGSRIGGVGAPCQLLEEWRAGVAVGTVWVRVPELFEDARRRRRQERGCRDRDQAARLDEVTEHVPQAFRGGLVAGLCGLVQVPRFLGVDEPVRLADERPDRSERLME